MLYANAVCCDAAGPGQRGAKGLAYRPFVSLGQPGTRFYCVVERLGPAAEAGAV